MRTIPESDWKVLRILSKVGYQRFCERALSEVSEVLSDTAKSKGDQFDEVIRRMKDRDGDLNRIFDNDSRSTAFIRILNLRSRSLLTDEEFARFSVATRDAVDNAVGVI